MDFTRNSQSQVSHSLSKVLNPQLTLVFSTWMMDLPSRCQWGREHLTRDSWGPLLRSLNSALQSSLRRLLSLRLHDTTHPCPPCIFPTGDLTPQIPCQADQRNPLGTIAAFPQASTIRAPEKPHRQWNLGPPVSPLEFFPPLIRTNPFSAFSQLFFFVKIMKLQSSHTSCPSAWSHDSRNTFLVWFLKNNVEAKMVDATFRSSLSYSVIKSGLNLLLTVVLSSVHIN